MVKIFAIMALLSPVAAMAWQPYYITPINQQVNQPRPVQPQCRPQQYCDWRTGRCTTYMVCN
jgi:hypothetical protein